jgi:hypothetical protein
MFEVVSSFLYFFAQDLGPVTAASLHFFLVIVGAVLLTAIGVMPVNVFDDVKLAAAAGG